MSSCANTGLPSSRRLEVKFEAQTPPTPQMNRYSVVFSVLLIPVAAFAQATEFRITSFRQGLVSFGPDGHPTIYSEGSKYSYSPNGTCVAANKESACLWHGFEITYESPDLQSDLQCTSEANQPRTEVKPGYVVARSALVVPWGFTLQGHSGKYLRPQYTIWPSLKKPLHEVLICYFKGREVLRYERTVVPEDSQVDPPVEAPTRAGDLGLLVMQVQMVEMNSAGVATSGPGPVAGFKVMNMETGKWFRQAGQTPMVEEVPSGTYCLYSVSALDNYESSYCGEPYFGVAAGKINNAGTWVYGFNFKGGTSKLLKSLSKPDATLQSTSSSDEEILQRYGAKIKK